MFYLTCQLSKHWFHRDILAFSGAFFTPIVVLSTGSIFLHFNGCWTEGGKKSINVYWRPIFFHCVVTTAENSSGASCADIHAWELCSLSRRQKSLKGLFAYLLLYRRCWECISQLETRVKSHNSASEVVVPNTVETCVLNHSFKFLLARELADAFYQILVRLPVSSDHLSQNRNHLETVCVIKPCQHGICHFAEL